MNIKTIWKDGTCFEAHNEFNQPVVMESHGGESKERGPTPMELILYGLAGCTGIDTVGILKKMRMEPDRFEIDIQAERATEPPKVYTKIHLVFRFWGTNLNEKRIERAVSLSHDSYCSVSAMIQSTATITYEIKIEQT
jgi:putative redox protein